jgi:hypothetical protein
MSRVVYELEDQQQILRELLVPMCDALAAAYKLDHPRDYIHRAVMTRLGMAAANVAECSFCFKHPAFREEKEWRLIRLSALSRETPYKAVPSFRPRHDGLVPYVPLSTERKDDVELPIAEIVVGPGAHPDLAVTAAQHLLELHSYTDVVKIVRRSEIPLRV